MSMHALSMQVQLTALDSGHTFQVSCGDLTLLGREDEPVDWTEESGAPEHGAEVLVSGIQNESKVLLCLLLDLLCKQVSTLLLVLQERSQRPQQSLYNVHIISYSNWQARQRKYWLP